MFDIEYRGGNNVVITTKSKSLVVDANSSVFGKKPVKLSEASVQLATEQRLLLAGDSSVLALEGPGEYEVGPFTIKGVAARRAIDQENEPMKSTIYRVEIGDIAVGILGNIAPKLDDEQLGALGVLDILVIPIGGAGYTLDATDAVKLVRQIEPHFVVPVHYADNGLKYEVEQESAERFEHELAASIINEVKLKIKNASSIPSTLTVCKLEVVS